MKSDTYRDQNFTLTSIVYALQLAGFLLGLTFLVAIVINYVKRKDVQNTWIASHFDWQIRTFWFGLIWAIVGAATSIILIGFVILGIDTIWVIYRVIKGWIYLYEHKAMYNSGYLIK